MSHADVSVALSNFSKFLYFDCYFFGFIAQKYISIGEDSDYCPCQERRLPNQKLLCQHLYREREMDSVFTSLMLGAQTQLKFIVFSISQMFNFKYKAANNIVAAVDLHPQANSKNVLFMYK